MSNTQKKLPETRRFSVRYVHKISPRADDRGPDVDLSDADLKSNGALAKVLRDKKAGLQPGGRISSFRIDKNDGHISAFPGSGWHCIILTPKS